MSTRTRKPRKLNRLKLYIDAKAVSQNQLAEKTGLSVYRVSRICRGADVRPEERRLIAEALDVKEGLIFDIYADLGEEQKYIQALKDALNKENQAVIKALLDARHHQQKLESILLG